jgi:hypothetical protein
MLLRICCAMLLCVKSRLLSGDFVANIKLLQHYPDDINLEYLLQVAQDISPDTSSYILSLWFITVDIFINFDQSLFEKRNVLYLA